MGNVSVITGATGLVGSHIAEQLCERGVAVRAVVRGQSDTRFLKTLSVEIVVADLRDLRSNPRALENAGTVYHCAAFVRDWGTWADFYDGTVEITRRLLIACRQAGAGRFVHISSISVFGNPPESAGQITEDMPTGEHLWPGDHYGRSKILAEQVVREYDDHVIMRPSWIYGRRDMVSIPRVLDALRRRRVKLIGSGDNLLNLVNARDVARGVVMAADSPQARGQAYHLCSRGEITQREFFEFLAEHCELPRPRRRVPVRIAWTAASVLESIFRIAGSKSPPPFTRRAILMLSRPIRFSIAKAERELGWRPEIPIYDGLKEALQWQLRASDACLPEDVELGSSAIGQV
ncbi:MAG: NAD-dependent epimerase/dehydratase family protein [Pirellulales bacterium]